MFHLKVAKSFAAIITSAFIMATLSGCTSANMNPMAKDYKPSIKSGNQSDRLQYSQSDMNVTPVVLHFSPSGVTTINQPSVDFTQPDLLTTDYVHSHVMNLSTETLEYNAYLK